jgi:hypothetical protein
MQSPKFSAAAWRPLPKRRYASYAARPVPEQRLFLATAEAPSELPARHSRPHLLLEKLPKAPCAVLLHDPEREPLAPLLERSAYGFRLRLACEPGDLLDETFDVGVLDVQGHGLSYSTILTHVNHG